MKKKRLLIQIKSPLIDKAKEEEAVKQKKTDKITQSSRENSFASGLTLSIRRCFESTNFWLLERTLGLPYDEDLLVR